MFINLKEDCWINKGSVQKITISSYTCSIKWRESDPIRTKTTYILNLYYIDGTSDKIDYTDKEQAYSMLNKIVK